MSLRLEMLQVARLASQQLGESRELVAAFLRSRLNPDGGFQNRAGQSDLYYTVFGLEGLIALQEPVPADRALSYLVQFGSGDRLDLVHLSSLVRCHAALSRPPLALDTAAVLEHLESFRSRDGGYALAPGAEHGNAYAAFLATGAHQDLGAAVPAPERVLASLNGLRAADGAYANRRSDPHGITTVTAAAVAVTRALDGRGDPHLGVWLLDRCLPGGGFVATPGAPVPDLLSTATALHALAARHVPLGGLAEANLDFVDSLWTNRGGFYGSWVDDTLDCEYTYYGLLALGHLTIATPA